MLRMPEFQVSTPTSVQEAVAMRRALPESMYVAGGTDLLPNLKHGLHHPKHLISLADVRELVGVAAGDSVRIGACTTLHAVATSLEVPPGLALAAGLVAGPQHRRMGTLGGNVMLDTRCLFYNQSEHWRQSLGYCLKKDGDWCHVVGSKATCVAAQSSDTVPMLIALGASIEVVDGDGPRIVPLDAIYQQDGRFAAMHALPAEALVTAILIPALPTGHRSTYRKVRSREAVDFPQLGVAIAASFAEDRCTSLAAVIGAVMPKPKVLKNLDAALGTTLDDDTIEALANEAFKQTRPQSSLHGDSGWRRHLARVEMRRALRAMRGDRVTLRAHHVTEGS